MREVERIGRVFVAFIAVILVSSAFLGCLGGGNPSVEKIQERGKLIVGTSSGFPPFEMLNASSGDLEGLDIDIAKLLAERMEVDIEFRDLSFDALVGAVVTGQIDIAIAGMSITPERLESVAFSDPYYKADQAILVKESNTDITSVENLEGKKIAVNLGTTGDFWVQENLIDTGLVDESDVQSYGMASDAVLSLVSGQVDAVIIDSPVAAAYVAATSGLKVVYTIVTEEYYGIAINKDADDLVDYVNEFLEELEETNQMQEIVDKWF